jgi:hypothetical protein
MNKINENLIIDIQVLRFLYKYLVNYIVYFILLY